MATTASDATKHTAHLWAVCNFKQKIQFRVVYCCGSIRVKKKKKKILHIKFFK